MNPIAEQVFHAGIYAYLWLPSREKRIPLEGELNAICDTKDFSNDVFLIDDLRVYEDGPYQGGNWPLRESLGGSDIRFVEDLLKSSHYIIKDYRFGGFLTIFPIIKAS